MFQDAQQILSEFRSGKKSLELCCYVAGAGAFGVFLRWLQLQLGFNELGLADPSFLHIAVILFVLATAVVFYSFISKFRKQLLYLPDDFSGTFSNEGRWYLIARIAFGLLLCAGAALLYMQTELDKYSADYRILSILGLLSGVAFPIWLGLADRRPQAPAWLLCVLAFFPMLFLAAWIIVCYKMNTINSVLWSFVPELGAVAAAMFAFFRLGGFVFGRPQWSRCLFSCMFAASLCLLSLADERYLGMQIIFAALALELMLCCWIMVRNFLIGEAPPKVQKSTGGFESLN